MIFFQDKMQNLVYSTMINTKHVIYCIATLLLEKWEDDTHTLEMGTWESTGTPEILEFDCKGQKTSH